FVPLKVEAKLGNSENVFFLGVDIHVVIGMRKRRRLNVGTDWRRVIALDLPLEFLAEAFNLTIVAGKFSATAADIDGIATNELFFTWILQVLPTGHPGNR